MAVAVTCTMASRGLRMRGSATCSLRMSRGPCQQRARISAPPAVRGERTRVGDLARFHHLLESPEILAHLAIRALAEHRRQRRADLAGGRRIVQLYGDIGRAHV